LEREVSSSRLFKEEEPNFFGGKTRAYFSMNLDAVSENQGTNFFRFDSRKAIALLDTIPLAVEFRTGVFSRSGRDDLHTS
jgi:hypothetical protein